VRSLSRTAKGFALESATEPNGHDVVVVGASAGGVEALRAMVQGLPADLDATIFVVLHLPPSGTSVLPRILSRAGRLRAVHASDGVRFERGCIYIAPPDQHMRFADGHVTLDRGPTENGHRPAVDPMFRSAAETFGSRVVGVVLSGVLDDGAAGLVAVKSHGGATLVQSVQDAMYPTMPASALEAVGESAVVGDAGEIAEAIVALTRRPPSGPAPTGPASDPVGPEETYIEVERSSSDQPREGLPSGYTCPECHGALWEALDADVTRFRCRTGHEFSPETLLVLQHDHVERALWAALRALEEKAAMLRRMSIRFRERSRPATAARLDRKANGILEEAVTLRKVLRGLEPVADAFDDERAAEA
jgi:two-component system, chemotaxis family, protein-glutamate methylesterase/glutaminase